MAQEDGLTTLAKMLKERENESPSSVITGIVIAAPPDIKLKVGDIDDLDREDVIIAEHLLEGYTRQITLNGSPSTITFTDTLKVGDEVIVIPTIDEQLYYVVAKAVTL